MPAITIEPVTTAPEMTCGYCHRTNGFERRPQRLVNSTWSPAISYATGCCIQAFVATMKNPERTAPNATPIDASQCARGPIRDSPNRNTPSSDDSAKNANTPSMNSVCPTTGPAYLEKRAQFVPN